MGWRSGPVLVPWHPLVDHTTWVRKPTHTLICSDHYFGKRLIQVRACLSKCRESLQTMRLSTGTCKLYVSGESVGPTRRWVVRCGDMVAVLVVLCFYVYCWTAVRDPACASVRHVKSTGPWVGRCVWSFVWHVIQVRQDGAAPAVVRILMYCCRSASVFSFYLVRYYHHWCCSV